MRRTVVRTAAVAVALLLGGTGVAFATGAVSLAGETIKACAQNTTGALRIADACRAGEHAVSWNTEGPQGPQGPPGPQGAQGAQGPAGGPPEPHTQVLGTLTIAGVTAQGTAIDVRGVRLSVANSGTGSVGTGSGAGKAVFGPLEVTKAFDATSPELYESAALGRHHPSATLALSTPGASAPYLTFQLSDVFVSKLEHSAGHETVELVAASTAVTAGTGAAPASPGPDRGDLTFGTLGVDVLALDWSIAQTAGSTAGGSGAGRAQLSPFAVTIPASASGGAALEDVATGRHQPTGSLSATGRTYSFKDLVATSWELASDGAAGHPPTITLGIDAAETTETVGEASFCFDKAANARC